jgi:hypothetical protein
MNLRCKVFRAVDATELEERVNRFLEEELPTAGPVQLEEISPSEGPGGVTLIVWYSRADESELDLSHDLRDELDDEDAQDVRKELA